jgi:hypothetical protein
MLQTEDLGPANADPQLYAWDDNFPVCCCLHVAWIETSISLAPKLQVRFLHCC